MWAIRAEKGDDPMKVYLHPVSTTSRPILLFAADHDLDLDVKVVDLFTGEQQSAAYAAINPNCMVPVLEDGDFRLTESSAILQYLADKIDSPAYPKDPRKRARVNEMMAWFATNLCRDFNYGLVYPQVFPNLRRADPTVQAGHIEWGREHARRWLTILDQHLIGPDKPYLCGDEVTLADYVGAAMLTSGELVGCDFSPWPNVARWLDNMKRRPNWAKVNDAFYGLVESVPKEGMATL
jgi:glutathione S-transferase